MTNWERPKLAKSELFLKALFLDVESSNCNVLFLKLRKFKIFHCPIARSYGMISLRSTTIRSAATKKFLNCRPDCGLVALTIVDTLLPEKAFQLLTLARLQPNKQTRFRTSIPTHSIWRFSLTLLVLPCKVTHQKTHLKGQVKVPKLLDTFKGRISDLVKHWISQK